MLKDRILEALKEAINRAGKQTELAKLSGISQGRISDYINGRYNIGNMTVDTLISLFPELDMTFFYDDKQIIDQTLPVEDRLLEYYRALSPNDKVKCLMLIAASFPEQVLKG